MASYYGNILDDDNGTNPVNWSVIYFLEDEDYAPHDELPPIITILFILVGVIGNSLVCLAVILDRKLQTLTNYFLLSLAVTDLLVCLLILPGRMITVRHEFKPATFPLCFLYLIGDDFITAASAIHICFISLERYLAIKDPLFHRKFTRRRVAIKISLVWSISFLTIIPYMLMAIITKHPSTPTYCSYLLSNFVNFNAIVFVEALVIGVMVVVVVVSFILTIILLRRLSTKQKENTLTGDIALVKTVGGKTLNDATNKKKARQVIKKEKKAVWLVSFAFILCMAPYTCVSLFYVAFPTVIIPPVLLEIVAYLNYLSSVINPIIYTIFNKTYRDDFKNIILFKFKKDN